MGILMHSRETAGYQFFQMFPGISVASLPTLPMQPPHKLIQYRRPWTDMVEGCVSWVTWLKRRIGRHVSYTARAVLRNHHLHECYCFEHAAQLYTRFDERCCCYNFQRFYGPAPLSFPPSSDVSICLRIFKPLFQSTPFLTRTLSTSLTIKPMHHL